MNWDDMRVFLALARSGTLAGAARGLGQDATTVARRIQRLEAAISTTLFEHGLQGQTLTEAGHRLLAHAEAMEGGALAIQQNAESGGALSGTIRVSLSEGFGNAFIAPRLSSFTSAYPGIAIDLIASTGFLNPSRREADIAIMLARPKGGPLIASKLTDYRLGVYGSRRYLDGSSPLTSLEELRDRPLIGYVPDLIYAPELRYLAEVDERLEAHIRSSSIMAQAALIAGGAGCGILPCFMGDIFGDLVRLFPDEVAIERRFWLVVHRDMRRVARIELFLSWLRAQVAGCQSLLLGRAE